MPTVINITTVRPAVQVDVLTAKNAYQLAVEGGFTGTQAEWLASGGVSNFADLADKSSADLPSINTPLATALALKLNTNDVSVTNARDWTADTVDQAEAEAGSSTTRRAWTSQRVRQNITVWWSGITLVSANISDATSAATPNMVAKRGTSGEAAFGDQSITGFAGDGVKGASYGGNGVNGASYTGTGVFASSYNGTGSSATTSIGTYHSMFGSSGDNRSAIARVLGALVWFRGAYTATLQAVSTLTGNRTYTGPDKSGTLALTSDISDHAAATDPHGDRAYAAGLGSSYVPTTRTVNGNALSADVTITTITGNAGTATKLATARTIAGVSFDGSANITITAANVSAVAITGNETVAGNKTLSGQLELTGQAATNATSAMTRGLADDRYNGYLRNNLNFANNTNWSTTVSGSGTALYAMAMGMVLVSASPSSYGSITARPAGSGEASWSIGSFVGSGYGGIDFGKVIDLSFTFWTQYNFDITKQDWAVVLSNMNSSAGVAAMTPSSGAYYVAIVCIAGVVTLQVCNNTTKTTSSTLMSITSTAQNYLMRLRNLGNGTVELYRNNVLLGSCSGGPTGTQAAGEKLFFCETSSSVSAGIGACITFGGINLSWI